MACRLIGLFFVHDLGHHALTGSQPSIKLGLAIAHDTGTELDLAGEALDLAQTPKRDKGNAAQVIGDGLVAADNVGLLVHLFETSCFYVRFLIIQIDRLSSFDLLVRHTVLISQTLKMAARNVLEQSHGITNKRL